MNRMLPSRPQPVPPTRRASDGQLMHRDMARKKDRSRRRQAAEPSPKVRERTVTPYFVRVDAFVEQHALSIFLFVIVAVKLVVFRDFVSFKNVYLFKDIGSDSINSTYATLYHVVDYLRTDGIPKWSFNQGMGQNLFGVLTFEPFLGVFYLVGPERVPYAMAFVELAKEILGGLFFFLYLREIRVAAYSAIVGGLLFAFTGYVILGGGWYIFSYDALCIAVLLYAYEKLRNQNTWYLLPIPFALIAAYQPFELYLYALLLIVYSLVRSLETSPWLWRNAALSVIKAGALGFLGVLVSAPFFLSNVIQILNSPRVGGEASFFHILSSQPAFKLAPPAQYVSEVLRFFSNDLMGTGNAFRGWQNYLEAPLLYAGLITLLLVPQCIAVVNWRRKNVYIALLVLCALPLTFPYFRYAFWLFAGDYFRTFTFFVDLALIYVAIQGLSIITSERNTSVLTVVFTVVGLLLVLYFPTPTYERLTVIDDGLRTLIAVLLVIHGALLIGLRAPRLVVLAKFGILIAIVIEAGYFANITVNKRSLLSTAELSQRTGFNDYTREAIDYLDSLDTSFYRVAKDYASGPTIHASLNDGMIQRYQSTTAYHPFNQRGYIEFLQTLDVIHAGNEIETRWAPGPANRLVLQSLTSVKYYLTKRPDQNAFGATYDHIADFQDVHVFRNRYALPLGFCYDAYMPASSFAKLTPGLKDQAILEAAVVEDRDMARLTAFQPLQPSALVESYTIDRYAEDTRTRRRDTLSIRAHSQNHISGTITVSQKKLMFLSIPFDRGWSARIDGKDATLLRLNAGFMGLILEPGSHTISLEFQPPYLVAGAGISLMSIVVFGALLFRSRLPKPSEDAA
jgi:uncharacterized membrane protein YfhO